MLQKQGAAVQVLALPCGVDDWKAYFDQLQRIPLGITGAAAGFTQTGAVLPLGPGRGQAISLVPETHFDVLRRSDLV